MIRLKDLEMLKSLKNRVPEIVKTRMRQFVGDDGLYDPDRHGYLIWVEPGDDLVKDIPEGGDRGLHTYLDDEFQHQFEFVRVSVEDGIKIYEAVMQINNEKTIAVFISETFPLHEQLRLVLEMEAECSPD